MVVLCLLILIEAHFVETDFTVVFVHIDGVEWDLGLVRELVELPGVA